MRKDVTRRPLVSAEMLGMPGFVVLAAGEYGGELELLTETVETTTGCPDCGVVAEVHARRPHLVRDVPAGGRPVLLVWSKRVWRCPEPDCARRTWTETHPQVRPKAALTERARQWAGQRVGRGEATVERVRRELGVGWHTVMRAVRDYGTPLVADPARLAGVTGLGVDEHAWRRANARRRTQSPPASSTSPRAARRGCSTSSTAGRAGCTPTGSPTASGPGASRSASPR